ncbi:hypothetical protein PR048_007863 [Dryococelus australis]|uniref:Uncharacterized protein n=1 Tax=Dryococelus australis TaxID=614101 RepID=A0ABQ9HVF8_9NEOP|nr:hypothetical protein PR048_007863 [Dryococelus australis]
MPFSQDVLAENQFNVGTRRLVVRSQRDQSTSSDDWPGTGYPRPQWTNFEHTSKQLGWRYPRKKHPKTLRVKAVSCGSGYCRPLWGHTTLISPCYLHHSELQDECVSHPPDEITRQRVGNLDAVPGRTVADLTPCRRHVVPRSCCQEQLDAWEMIAAVLPEKKTWKAIKAPRVSCRLATGSMAAVPSLPGNPVSCYSPEDDEGAADTRGFLMPSHRPPAISLFSPAAPGRHVERSSRVTELSQTQHPKALFACAITHCLLHAASGRNVVVVQSVTRRWSAARTSEEEGGESSYDSGGSVSYGGNVSFIGTRDVTSGREVCDCEYQAVKDVAVETILHDTRFCKSLCKARHSDRQVVYDVINTYYKLKKLQRVFDAPPESKVVGRPPSSLLSTLYSDNIVRLLMFMRNVGRGDGVGEPANHANEQRLHWHGLKLSENTIWLPPNVSAHALSASDSKCGLVFCTGEMYFARFSYTLGGFLFATCADTAMSYNRYVEGLPTKVPPSSTLLQPTITGLHLRACFDVVAKLLASHLGEPGSIPGGVTPGFPRVRIVLDDAAGWWVFSGISRFPRPFIPALMVHEHPTFPTIVSEVVNGSLPTMRRTGDAIGCMRSVNVHQLSLKCCGDVIIRFSAGLFTYIPMGTFIGQVSANSCKDGRLSQFPNTRAQITPPHYSSSTVQARHSVWRQPISPAQTNPPRGSVVDSADPTMTTTNVSQLKFLPYQDLAFDCRNDGRRGSYA